MLISDEAVRTVGVALPGEGGASLWVLGKLVSEAEVCLVL